MSFGLTNIPALFYGYINKILAEKLDVFIIMYLDDIFIYTENKREEYIKIGIGATTKAFLIYQTQKVSISLRRDKICSLHYLSSRYPNRRKVNQGYT